MSKRFTVKTVIRNVNGADVTIERGYDTASGVCLWMVMATAIDSRCAYTVLHNPTDRIIQPQELLAIAALEPEQKASTP